MFGRGIKGYLLDFLKLNIKRGDLVLEIGSGERPFIRADILVDKFIKDDTEREGKLMKDRPLVCSDIENLPFKDKSFDYIYCSHIVEHMKTPEKGFEEMMRVGKKGFIVTPSPLFEKLQGWSVHRWFVGIENGVIVLNQKEKGTFDDTLCNFWYGLDNKIHGRMLNRFVRHYDNYLETRYEWDGRIKYRIYYSENIKKETFIAANTYSHNPLISGKNVAIRELLKRRFISITSKLVRRLHSGRDVE